MAIWGGDYNELGSYYFVSDEKAHVWVEAFIEGSGWVRIDPSSFASNAGDVWRSSISQSFRLRINLLFDSFNYAWNKNVISYDFEQQVNIARKVGSRLQEVDISKNLRSLAPYFTALALLLGLLFVARNSPLLRSREQRILHRFLRKVESEFGIAASGGVTGLFEIASTVENIHLSEFTDIFAGAVYRDRKLTDDEYLRLQKLLRLMKSKNAKKA